MRAGVASGSQPDPDGERPAGASNRSPVLIADLLRRARLEVLPLDGVEETVREHLGTDVKITVTASPTKGLDATFDLSERLVRAGYRVEPHLSARLVTDRSHLDAILDRLRAGGVTEVFVLAGDPPEPAGNFHGAAELLEAMGPRRAEFEAIGITGYPESHHLISDEETIRAMFAKAEMATHIVSQICFDAQVITGWVEQVRRRGTHLPIWIGLPGHVDYRKLLRVSMKIGLGGSTRFLRQHHGWLSRLLSRQFKPDHLLEELTPFVVEPAWNVAGLHLYTFNEVERTERWRRRMLDELAGR
jgi:methylenetetrahydrofolate reductase (NADPH)